MDFLRSLKTTRLLQNATRYVVVSGRETEKRNRTGLSEGRDGGCVTCVRSNDPGPVLEEKEPHLPPTCPKRSGKDYPSGLPGGQGSLPSPGHDPWRAVTSAGK